MTRGGGGVEGRGGTTLPQYPHAFHVRLIFWARKRNACYVGFKFTDLIFVRIYNYIMLTH